MNYRGLEKSLTVEDLKEKISEVNPNPNVENVLKIFNELYQRYEDGQCVACALMED